MSRPGRILIIDDDKTSSAAEAAVLKKAGYQVTTGDSALDGLKKLYETRPDLIIITRELKMIGKEDPCLRIRQAAYLPILVLGIGEDAAEALELGADAYLASPPSAPELVARVKSLLRRTQDYDPPDSHHKLDSGTEPPGNGEKPGGLTRTEYRLASCLILNKGRLLGYLQLINEVWGGKKVGRATLHYYIRQLRRKLTGLSISSLRGVGYYVPGDISQ